MKTSLTYYPNVSKKSLRNGKTPIYMRICVGGKKSETRLNAELNEQQLSIWNKMTMRVSEKNSPINHCLNRLEQKFNDFLILNADSLPEYDAPMIKDFVMGTNTAKKVVAIEFVDDFFKQAVLNNVNLKPGTVKNYRRSINHLVNFLSMRNEKQLRLEQFDFEHASDFKNYLTSSNPALDRIGMTEVSAAGVIKKFRTIFGQALDGELIKKNPFKLLKIKTKSPKRERMSIGQVKQLYDLDLANYPGQVFYRDLYLYQIFTGLAYRDLISHSWNNLLESGNNIKLSLARAKTEEYTEMFLVSFAIEIAENYKRSKARTGNLVFPYRSNKEMNSQLKLIASLAKIQIRLTTHIARHTFRQLLAEAGINDFGVIKKMMGQSYRDVDSIYYSITDSRLQEAMGKFESYLKTNLL